jgi:hypothetical protein
MEQAFMPAVESHQHPGFNRCDTTLGITSGFWVIQVFTAVAKAKYLLRALPQT